MTTSRKRAAQIRKARDVLIERWARAMAKNVGVSYVNAIHYIANAAHFAVQQDRRMRARTKETK